MAFLNFDASQVDPSVAYEAIPADKYLVEITDSETKPTKNGNGTLLQFEYTVIARGHLDVKLVANQVGDVA